MAETVAETETAAGADVSAPAGARPVPGLPEGYCLAWWPELDSSNERARQLAEAGAEDGTLVRCGRQSAGRGRRGRPWLSPAGNLHASVIWRLGGERLRAGQAGLVAALGLCDALTELAGQPTRIKWPNDIRLGDAKIAGLLLECDPQARDWLVIGAGVNVAARPEGLDQPVTSLHAAGAHGVSPEAVLAAFCRHLALWRRRWQREGGEVIRRAWLARATGLGDYVAIDPGNGQRLTGIFSDLDDSGALVLRAPDGSARPVPAGDLRV